MAFNPSEFPTTSAADMPLNHACETFNQLEELTNAVEKLVSQIVGPMPPVPTPATNEKSVGPSYGVFGLVGEKSEQARRNIAYAHLQLNRISEKL